MRVISGILYWLGLVLSFIGIWILQYNLPLSVRLLPIGLGMMGIGCVLEEYEDDM